MLINNGELNDRIARNYTRLLEKRYRYPDVFQKKSYSWQGDWEGRVLLALTCLWKTTGIKPKTLEDIMQRLNENLNDKMYFGDEFDGLIVDEQQVAGNSWFLRGLCEYYALTKDDNILKIILSIQNNFVLRLSKFYENYPIASRVINGNVSGNIACEIDGWKLSSDVGCAFIAIDGFTAVYEITNNERLKELIMVMIEKFISIDKVALKCQTHATLSAIRGIVRFYDTCKDKKYLEIALREFNGYLNYGMTINFQNYNWFDRIETWTEPCAIVDSLILSIKFFMITNENKYIDLVHKIYYNAIRLSQRTNGGAGCDFCTSENHLYLGANMNCYEAVFCCTMRLSEGLSELKKFQYKNQDNVININFLNSSVYQDDNITFALFYENKMQQKINIIINENENISKFKIYIGENCENIKANANFEYANGFLVVEIKNCSFIDIEYTLQLVYIKNYGFLGSFLLCENNEVVKNLDKDIILVKLNNKTYTNIVNMLNIPFANTTEVVQKIAVFE